MEAQSLAAQDSTTEGLKLSQAASAVAIVATSDDTDAAAHVGLQAEYISEVWVSVQLFDISSSTNVDYLTGASKAGWADVPKAQRIRLIRLDNFGGICKAAIGQANA